MAIIPVGFVGTVQEVDFSKMMSAVGSAGVVGTFAGTAFAASRVPGARSMSVQAGACWAPGVLVTMDATTTSPTSAANVSGLPRIDVVAMRIDWGAHTAALVNVAGTPAASPQPPAFANTSTTLYNQPGVKYDIPLRQAVLPSGDADYTAAAVSAGDRRAFLIDGVRTALSTTIFGAEPPGAVISQPNAHRVLVRNLAGTEWDIYSADSDTGWVDTGMAAPAGFSGTLFGRKLNGITELQWEWTKETAGTGTGITFSIGIPDGWRPGGKPIDGVLWAGGVACRVYMLNTGSAQYGPLTVPAGGMIRGGFTFIGQ